MMIISLRSPLDCGCGCCSTLITHTKVNFNTKILINFFMIIICICCILNNLTVTLQSSLYSTMFVTWSWLSWWIYDKSICSFSAILLVVYLQVFLMNDFFILRDFVLNWFIVNILRFDYFVFLFFTLIICLRLFWRWISLFSLIVNWKVYTNISNNFWNIVF